MKLKAIKDLKTPEDRAAFIEHLQEIATQEEMQSVYQFARDFLSIADVIRGEKKEGAPAEFQFLPAIINAISGNEELLNMTLEEGIKSGKLRDVIKRAFALQEKPPSLPTIINYYSFMNDLSAWEMVRTDGKESLDGQLSIWWEVIQKKGKTPVPVYISLMYSGDDVKISRKFTAFDRDVIDAVSTIFFYWRMIEKEIPLTITPVHIWRIMNGKQLNDISAKPSKKQIDKVCQSMDKMRFTKATIDCVQELSACDLSFDDKRFSERGGEDYLVNASKTYEKTPRGLDSIKYIIHYEPVLFSYNRLKKHVLCVPLRIMDTSSMVQNGENLQEFRSFLVRRIKNMISGSLTSNRILFETLYRDTGIEPPANRVDLKRFTSKASYQTKIRQEAKKDREKVEAVLSAWKKMGFIVDFAQVKKRGSVVGYDITYIREWQDIEG